MNNLLKTAINYVASNKHDICFGAGLAGIVLTGAAAYASGKIVKSGASAGKKIASITGTAIVGLGTAAAFIFSRGSRNKREDFFTALRAAEELKKTAQKSFENGVVKQTDIPETINKEEKLIFHETFGDEWFTSTLSNVLDAEYRSEKSLAETDVCSLPDFYLYLGHTKAKLEVYKEWCTIFTPFIGFKNEERTLENGEKYIEISASVNPEKPSEHAF